MFSVLLAEYNARLTEIKLKRYWGCSLFKTLQKRQVYCAKDEPEGTQNQVFDTFSFSKNT